MDTAGADACRPFVDAAAPDHPSLVDVGHRTAELFGVVNIPNGLWIDEDGVIVRPAEPAFPGARTRPGGDPSSMPPEVARMVAEAAKLTADDAAYADAVRDWAARGADSPFALSPDEVVGRSGRRDADVAAAAAHFDLAQHLYRRGDHDGAVRQFRHAHRLHPQNVSYKRQAWSLEHAGTGPYGRFLQGPRDGHEDEWPYEGDWLSEARDIGFANYYPPMR